MFGRATLSMLLISIALGSSGASAAPAAFTVSGTLADGAVLNGTVTIDTATGAVAGVNLQLGSPDLATFTIVGNSGPSSATVWQILAEPPVGAPGNVGCGSNPPNYPTGCIFPKLSLLLPTTTLVGYTGGSLCNNSFSCGLTSLLIPPAPGGGGGVTIDLQSGSLTASSNPPPVIVGVSNTAPNCIPFSCAAGYGINTYQQVYSSSAFSGVTRFNEITFFHPENVVPGLLDTGTYNIYFSYTSKPVNGLDPTNPSNNVGGGQTLFGAYVLSGTYEIGPSILTFDGAAFTYDPTLGNLLMTVTIAGASDSLATSTGYESDGSGSVTSRVFFGTAGGADKFGLVTGFDLSIQQVVTSITTALNALPPQGWNSSLLTKLQTIESELKQTPPPCADISAFENEVQAQSGKKLTVSQANQLVGLAQSLASALGCH